jgi:hypothetical protein
LFRKGAKRQGDNDVPNPGRLRRHLFPEVFVRDEIDEPQTNSPLPKANCGDTCLGQQTADEAITCRLYDARRHVYEAVGRLLQGTNALSASVEFDQNFLQSQWLSAAGIMRRMGCMRSV